MNTIPSMEAQLVGFNGSGAEVKASFPVENITSAFQEKFAKEWQKCSRNLSLGMPVVIEGNFVRIDEGSRWMRYLLTFFAGHAVVEVEGRALMGGNLVTEFHYTHKSGVGLFGGNSEEMVKFCARGAASRIAKTVAKKLAGNGG